LFLLLFSVRCACNDGDSRCKNAARRKASKYVAHETTYDDVSRFRESRYPLLENTGDAASIRRFSTLAEAREIAAALVENA
jgi:hypothetical protein